MNVSVIQDPTLDVPVRHVRATTAEFRETLTQMARDHPNPRTDIIRGYFDGEGVKVCELRLKG